MDDYKAVFPITWKKKYGIQYVVQPLLSQQLGVFSQSSHGTAGVESFLHLIPDKYKHIDICLNSSNELSRKDYKLFIRKNYELCCGGEKSDPAQGYSGNTKRNIRKALRNELQIKQTDVENYLDLRRQSDSPGFKAEHYKLLNRIFSGIIEKGRGAITGAYSSNKLCAAVFWAFSKTRVIYLNAVSNEEGKSTRAMFMLIDQYIRKYGGTNVIIDFEGSMIPGIARFFEGFGAKETTYLRIIKSSFPLNLKKVIK